MVGEPKNWMENYSSMETEELAVEPTSKPGSPFPRFWPRRTPNTIKTKPTKDLVRPAGILSKGEMKALLAVRNVIREHTRYAEEKARAQAISIIDRKAVGVDDNSTEGYIARVLATTDVSMHINDIITAIEAIGWKSESKYHKYSHVRKTLRDNYFMFERTEKATFKLREGFRGRAPIKIEKKPAIKYSETKLTTLEDIIADVMEKRKTKVKYGMYPAGVWYILRRMGYKRISYSSVYNAMQNKRFHRSGFWYTVNKTNDKRKNAKSSKSSKQR